MSSLKQGLSTATISSIGIRLLSVKYMHLGKSVIFLSRPLAVT